MGVSYWAEIVVGLPLQDMEEELINEVISYKYAEQGITPKASYYDGDDEGLFGITVKACDDYGYCLLDTSSLPSLVEEAKHTFFKHIGIEPNLYLTTRGG